MPHEHQAIDCQVVLFQRVRTTTLYRERRRLLHEILPQIQLPFFHVLARWAHQNPSSHADGVTLCEEVLDLIGFNDLRENWEEPNRTLIWGAAWFVLHDQDLRLLIESPHARRHRVAKAAVASLLPIIGAPKV
jgi:hypothetical protein